MEQDQFLEQHVFTDLKNKNDGFDSRDIIYFSETDFETVLKRVAHFGIGVYAIEPWMEGKLYDVSTNEEHRKKATDSKWYNKAFLTFRKRQTGLLFSATFKVSAKLLARDLPENYTIDKIIEAQDESE